MSLFTILILKLIYLGTTVFFPIPYNGDKCEHLLLLALILMYHYRINIMNATIVRVVNHSH